MKCNSTVGWSATTSLVMRTRVFLKLFSNVDRDMIDLLSMMNLISHTKYTRTVDTLLKKLRIAKLFSRRKELRTVC